MNSATILRIARLSALGGLVLFASQAAAEVELDPTFGVGGITWTAFGSLYSDHPRDLLIQPDGMILTAGKSEAPEGNYIAITRHSADGVIDAGGFGVDGMVLSRFSFRDHANDIALQPDGKIVAAGMQMTSTSISTQRQSLYRFHANGAVDTTFGDDGVVTEWGSHETGEKAGVKILADSRILAGGRRNSGYSGGFTGFSMRGYLADGTLAMGGIAEFEIDRIPGSCAFPEDGGLLLANLAALNGRREFVLARLDSLGSPVAEFGAGGTVQTGIEAAFNSSVRVLALPDGSILLAGTTPISGSNYQWSVFRFLANGTLDSSFGIGGRTNIVFGGGSNEACHDATIDASGRILLAGRTSDYGSLSAAFARLLPDGGLDPTFSDDGKFATALTTGYLYFTRVLALPDGRILAAGYDWGRGGGDFFLARFVVSAPSAAEPEDVAPGALQLAAFPNPSSDRTTLRFQLPREQAVDIAIYDLSGRLVRHVFSGRLEPGTRDNPWDGRDSTGGEAPAGTYFSRLTAGDQTWTTRLVRLR